MVDAPTPGPVAEPDPREHSIERLLSLLELAEKGSRELDAAVWAETLPTTGIGIDGYGIPDGGVYSYDAEDDGSVNMYVTLGDGQTIRRARRPSPHYTTSLDAALTLVPPKHDWRLWPDMASVFPDETPSPRHLPISNAKTPALALVIAALRARAAK